MSNLKFSSIIVQNVSPSIDGGRYPIKRRVGQSVTVTCEAYRHGHDKIDVVLKYRPKGKRTWQEVPMQCLNAGLDLYEAEFTVEELGFYEYQVEGYTDHYKNWHKDTVKKMNAGEDLSSDILAGIELLEKCADRSNATVAKKFNKIVEDVKGLSSSAEKVAVLLSEEVTELAYANPLREGFDCSGDAITYQVRVDRKTAEYAAWYEMFPRSAPRENPNVSGTFKDVENFLPYITDMGFDVLYFTPIHPIGMTKRKGKDNSLTAEAGEPGSPYAIGDASGGHFAVHPELGTLEDFDRLVAVAADQGLEIALDFALNCSPDHPYLKDHPDWFYKRPDGTIKCAENPPKKYEDIYPLNFECDDRKALWTEIKDSLMFWADHGVKIFRVDNPHTKPIEFWEWAIAEIQKKHQDVIFLSEAFTRPRLMESLAKVGFTQSYGYFTWRETKEELTEFFSYLTTSGAEEYMINNVFTTTPDILPRHLWHAPKEQFMIRFLLGATLGSVYGMYSGYELCENVPVGPREELIDNEKYELKNRDYWTNPNSIAGFIKQVNKIRKENPALQLYGNLKFESVNNDQMIAFSKKDGDNLILVVINLDPHNTQSANCHFNISDYGFDSNAYYRVQDLFTGDTYHWHGKDNYVELNPSRQIAHIFRVF